MKKVLVMKSFFFSLTGKQVSKYWRWGFIKPLRYGG